MLTTKGFQIGRFTEVEIRNFSTGVKTVIGNDFEMDFEFHKTIDDNQQNSTGKINIYGLTPERIKTLQTEGGEVRFRCGYVNAQIETLFVAYITRLYPTRKNNTTVTTIECSANMKNFYYTGGASAKNKGMRSLARIISDYSKALGAARVAFDINNVPDTKKSVIEDYIAKAGFLVEMYGSADSVLRALCYNFNLSKMEQETKTGKEFVFSFTQAGINKVLKETNNGYEKVVNDPSEQKVRDSFFYIYKASPEEYKNATYLSRSTGLIEAKTEYKIATAYEDQELSANETQTLASQQKQADRQAKRQEQANKDAKRLAEGKKVKPRVQKVGTIKVNRRYARVIAQLNPNVKPQSHIVVESIDDGLSDIYRVREATYRGNNKRGDFVMDLYCEDSSRKFDKRLTPFELVQQQQGEVGGEINGDLGTTEEVSGSGGESE